MNNQVPYEPLDSRPVTAGCFIVTLIILIIIIGGGGGLVFWLAYHHGTGMGLETLRLLQPPREEPLPRRYSIDSTFITPFHLQYNISNAFAFGSTHLLQSLYKHEAISRNKLPKNQYLRFSQNLIASNLVNRCKKINDSIHCPNGFPKNDVILFAHSFIDLKNTIIPYSKEKDEAYINRNFLQFTVIDSSRLRGIGQTKKLVLSQDRPLYFTMPHPMTRIWLNCTNPLVSNAIECTKNYYKCKDKNDSYCAPYDFPMSSELYYSKETDIELGEKTSQILVAYNDDFVPKSLTNSVTRGGFITLNNWGAEGHSLDYLMGFISDDEENRICPNKKNVLQWIPASFECAADSERVEECNSNESVIFGSHIYRGATPLRCINGTFCKVGKNYVLLEDKNTHLMSVVDMGGYKAAKVILIDNPSSIETIEHLPYQYLYYAFEPIKLYSTDYSNCGYVFLPYDMMNQIVSKQTPKTSDWHVIKLGIKWDDKSFPDINSSEYNLIKDSIYTFQRNIVSNQYNNFNFDYL